jgi:prepilin-type N-terminal cleavage/methylation domain-containing protein
MRSPKGFTLAELLAVIAILLFLMVAAFGVYGTLAQNMGPESAVSTIQAMLNGARDYAASNNKDAAVEFSIPKPDGSNYDLTNGTQMQLVSRPDRNAAWAAVPGLKPILLRSPVVVCQGLPTPESDLTPPTTVATNAQDPDASNLDLWKQNAANCLAAVDSFAMANHSPPTLKSNHLKFTVGFDGTGILLSDTSSSPVFALTVVQIGGGRVTAYALYPLNAISGTRIIFD